MSLTIRRELFWVFFGLIAIAVFVWLGLRIMQNTAEANLVEAEQILIEQGAPMTKEDLLREPVAEEDNALFLLHQASDFRDENDMPEIVDQLYDMSDELGLDYNKQLDVQYVSRFNAEQIDWLEEQLADPALIEFLTLIDDAAKRPDYWIDFRGYKGMDFVSLLIPEVGAVMDASRYTIARATVAVHRGNPELAVTQLKKVFALSRLIAQERTLVQQLIAVAITGMADEFVEEWTLFQELTNEQLAAIQNALQPPDFQRQLINAMDAERIFMGGAIFDMVQSGNAGEMVGMIESMSGSPSGPTTKEKIYGIGLQLVRFHFTNDEAYYVRTSGLIRGMLEEKGFAAVSEIRDYEQSISGELESKRYFFSAIILPVLGRMIESIASKENSIEITRTALSLLMYHNDHGAYPDDLEALVPEYLDAVPLDLFTGKPLVYRKVDDGFQLYSLGPNQTDDGGYEDPDDRHGFDVAWQGRGAVHVDKP